MSEHNHQLRAARQATPSPHVPSACMSRQELAEAVNAWLAENTLPRRVPRRPRRGNRCRTGVPTVEPAPHSPTAGRSRRARAHFSPDDELDALELARRVAASDIGSETLTRLDAVVDELATAYPRSSPTILLDRIRRHLGYVSQLLDARMTLAERRRILVAGGWLSLLGATVHVDLGQQASATARLKTAISLAEHAGHDEIRAWGYETEAWRTLAGGDYARAVELSRAAQAVAPADSSANIQATAQEGRAWARLGQASDTYRALAKVHKRVEPLRRPDTPEHHYRYDPDKSVGYTATTLAWLGDSAAEEYAREVIHRLAPDGDATHWPRRVATAHLDLALTLLGTNQPDEAFDATVRALESGRVVPSNRWRVLEVVGTAEARGLPEATTLREAYEELRPR